METISGNVLLRFCQGFLIIFVGYICQSSVLECWYYFASSLDRNSWKIQNKVENHSHGEFCFIPVISNKKNRAAHHKLFTFINLLVASSFGGFVASATELGRSSLTFESVLSVSCSSNISNCIDMKILCLIIRGLISAVCSEVVLEYYWHRLMHTKAFYKVFHKYHHAYTAPEVWDDMYIHPVEAFGYYCILYSPAFIFHLHIVAFVCYMSLMGVCGILDHSGIRFSIAGLYDTEDHDLHHSKFNVNYGFPFPWLDMLHGTYEGRHLGLAHCRKQG